MRSAAQADEHARTSPRRSLTCRHTSRLASTSRRSRRSPSRSRASGRRSPPSSVWRPAARSTGRCGSRTGPSSPASTATRASPRTARSCPGPTSPTPCTGSSRTAAACAGSCASAPPAAVPVPPRRRCPPAADSAQEALRAVARDGVEGDIEVTISEDPSAAKGEDETATDVLRLGHRGHRERVVRRPLAQEGPQLHRHQGQRRLAAGAARGDGRIAARREAQGGHLQARRCRRLRSRRWTPARSRATSPAARASAAWRRSTR